MSSRSNLPNPLKEEFTDHGISGLVEWLRSEDPDLLCHIYCLLRNRFANKMVECGSRGDVEGVMVWADRVNATAELIEVMGVEYGE